MLLAGIILKVNLSSRPYCYSVSMLLVTCWMYMLDMLNARGTWDSTSSHGSCCRHDDDFNFSDPLSKT